MFRKEVELRVSPYFDDLLLYTSDLFLSVPAMLTMFQFFGLVYRYNLDLSKSVIFLLNMATKKHLFIGLSLKKKFNQDMKVPRLCKQ